MSTFFIYAIVLTVGYILYYAATITIDLTAKKKSEISGEEKISIGDSLEDEDDDEYSQRRVVENVETGGFSFLSPDSEVEDPESDPAPDNIQEEEPLPAPDEDFSENVESEPVHDELDSLPDTQVEEDNPPEEEIPSILPVLDIAQSEKEEEDPVPFAEQEAFNPELSQGRYDVMTFIEPQVSEEIRSHADLVNDSLSSISRKGFLTDSFDLARIMKDKELRDKYNIDAKDEYTKF